MNTHLALGARVLGTAWLGVAAFVAAVLAAVGVPHGPYLTAGLFLALALLCAGGVIMLWRTKALHWVTIAALAASIGMAAYGQLYP